MNDARETTGSDKGTRIGERFAVRRVTTGDGLSLHVRDYPGPAGSTRTPLLCLAGLTRNSKDFHGLAKFHSRTRRVIAPDYRGRGRSDYDPVWKNYHPATYVNDIRHVLTALGVHRVVVVGTSMGGTLGMAMGAAMPSVLAGVVINDVGPLIRRETVAPIVEHMVDNDPMPNWDAAAKRLRDAFPDYPAQSDEEWLAIAMGTYVEDGGVIRSDWDPAIVKPLLADPQPELDLWPLFLSLSRVPVLTFRGAKSDILDADLLAEMARRHPRFTAVTVPGVGHAPSLGEPVCVEALNGFLEAF